MQQKLKAPFSPRPFFFSFWSSIFTTTRSLPRRALSFITEPEANLFDYTSGRWVQVSYALFQRIDLWPLISVFQLQRRSSPQGAKGHFRYRRTAPTDVVSLSKLAEGGFNPTFVIALRDGRQVVARVPYLRGGYYRVPAVLRDPVPEIYRYSADSDNVAGTPYILMDFVHGSKLSDIWRSLKDKEVISLTQLESRMMSQAFPANGSLYFTKDLEKVASVLGVPLEDKRFCVGPDTTLALWYGRRTGLDVNRGPYHSAKAALAAATHKEIAYLKQVGQALLPLQRERRPSYKYRPQSPSDHVKNLERRFCIRHPDLQPNNVFVSWSPGSDCKSPASLTGNTRLSCLHIFSLPEFPQRLQNHADSTSQSMTPPSRPENLDEMGEAGGPWEGETFDLKAALIQAMNRWEELTGGGVPCPIEFDTKDLDETVVLDEVVSTATRGFEFLQSIYGVGEQGWAPPEGYEGAVAFFEECKEEALAGAESEKGRGDYGSLAMGRHGRDVYVTNRARYFVLLYLICNLYIWAGQPRSSNCSCQKRLAEEEYAVCYMLPCRSQRTNNGLA
ncbi:hypothetical protein H0H87_012686 [Tephrocybe sp. NHM501043]|nr:hypothetical protein H0H87_012686 [Tephrocybe sp. NHM501043]